jgi:uncharacterized membrane protein/protein-disulfide isomerase
MNIHRKSIFIILASILGIISAYLSWSERVLLLAGIAPQGSLCAISSAFNCQVVSTSAYATVLGIPLAVLGISFYIITLFAGIYLIKAKPGKVYVGAFGILSFAALLFSAYLFYVSKFLLGVLCLYCLLMYFSNIALAVIGYLLLKQENKNESITSTLIAGFDSPWAITKAIFLNDPSGSRWLALLSLILSIGILVGFRSLEPLMLPTVSNNSNESAFISSWKNRPIETIKLNISGSALDNDFVKGNSSAAIEIIEFSDFECSACRNFHVIVEKILKAHPDKIRFANKFFPLDQACNQLMTQPMHQNACYAANFVRCAGEQGQQWSAFDKAFTEPAMEIHDPNRTQLISSLFEWAKGSGMDVTGLSECINSNRQIKKIKEDIDLAVKLNVQHTPTFFVNGRKTNADELEHVVNYLAKN